MFVGSCVSCLKQRRILKLLLILVRLIVSSNKFLKMCEVMVKRKKVFVALNTVLCGVKLY